MVRSSQKSASNETCIQALPAVQNPFNVAKTKINGFFWGFRPPVVDG
jgi:hypothetical protein